MVLSRVLVLLPGFQFQLLRHPRVRIQWRRWRWVQSTFLCRPCSICHEWNEVHDVRQRQRQCVWTVLPDSLKLRNTILRRWWRVVQQLRIFQPQRFVWKHILLLASSDRYESHLGISTTVQPDDDKVGLTNSAP